MNEINLWGSYIWKFTYEFDYDSLKPYIDNIFSYWSVSKETSLVESGDALSTVSVGVYDAAIQPHNLPILDDYHNWLSSRIAFVWDKLEYTIRASEISKSWFNIHRNGGKTLEHAHNRTDPGLLISPLRTHAILALRAVDAACTPSAPIFKNNPGTTCINSVSPRPIPATISGCAKHAAITCL